ncbi:MAG: MFS transporter [Micrococcales bacterium]
MTDRSVLKDSQFRKLWLGQGISVFGDQFTGLAIPVLAVTILHATEWQMGVLNAFGTAAFLLVGLIAGAWVDRWLKRRVMIVADLIRFATLLSIPILWFAGQLQIWHLFLVAGIVGVAAVFFDVAYQSYIPILVSKEHIGPANSYLETTNQVAGVAGPSVVGFLLTLVKAPVLLVIDSASYLVSVLALSRIRDQETPKPATERRPLRVEIAEGIRFVWNQPLIRTISFTTATSNLFSSMIFTLMPLYVLRTLGISTALWGAMMSAAAIGGLLGASATGKLIKLVGEGPLIAVSALVSGLALGLVPLAASMSQTAAVVTLTIAEFVISFTVLTYNITQVTARQKLCPKPLLGRMNASIRFFVWGVMPIGSLAAGGLATAFGTVSVLWIGFAGTLAAAGFVLFSPLARLRELPSVPQEID